MKGAQCSKNHQKDAQARRNHWKKLFKSRLVRRQSLREKEDWEEFEF